MREMRNLGIPFLYITLPGHHKRIHMCVTFTSQLTLTNILDGKEDKREPL